MCTMTHILPAVLPTFHLLGSQLHRSSSSSEWEGPGVAPAHQHLSRAMTAARPALKQAALRGDWVGHLCAACMTSPWSITQC
jgi:hypothetical protein